MPAIQNDLTQGSVTRKLIRYALPLVASSLLQALYSITDFVIAGHFIGDAGISAINNASIIMNMLTQVAIGLTVGGNILVGQFFGQGDETMTQYKGIRELPTPRRMADRALYPKIKNRPRAQMLK